MENTTFPSEIATNLRSLGYDVANILKKRQDEPDKEAIGILKPRNPRNFLGIKIKQRALYLGTLWFENEFRNAEPDKRWVLEAQVSEVVPELTKLVKILSEPFDVDVQVGITNGRVDIGHTRDKIPLEAYNGDEFAYYLDYTRTTSILD